MRASGHRHAASHTGKVTFKQDHRVVVAEDVDNPVDSLGQLLRLERSRRPFHPLRRLRVGMLYGGSAAAERECGGGGDGEADKHPCAKQIINLASSPHSSTLLPLPRRASETYVERPGGRSDRSRPSGAARGYVPPWLQHAAYGRLMVRLSRGVFRTIRPPSANSAGPVRRHIDGSFQLTVSVSDGRGFAWPSSGLLA